MKALFAVLIFFMLTTILPAAEQATSVYDEMVLTEDVTWSGSILVRGFVVVAPQATLRIDPGTVVRFSASATQQQPNLVVQGRLHAAGTPEKPVILMSALPQPERGSWGGIVFLSTEKRNLLEQCRIEYAATGIDLLFSTVTLKNVSIMQTNTALLSHDGIVQMTGGTVSGSSTGIEMHDSEFAGRGMTVDSCQRGFLLDKSSVVLLEPTVVNNRQSGAEASECRIKISGGEFSGNVVGARINGGEGQIVMTRFLRNSQTALHLLGSRLKIHRCLFADNLKDALRTEDGRALLLNNAFVSNVGFNLYNAGSEAVSARQNWWGTVEQSLIRQKTYDASRDKNSGVVEVLPWLNEKPALTP